MEVVREFFDVTGVREIVTEGMGIKGNGYGMNRSRYCSQRDRRKTIRRRGGRAPSCLGSSRQRMRSVVNNGRRKRRSGGKGGGGIVRHDGDGFSEGGTKGGRQRGEVFYKRRERTWHFSSPIQGPKSPLWPNILSIGSGRNGKREFHDGV